MSENINSKNEQATFAGGCFWCMQQPFENTPGVVHAIVGYAGGTGQHPTYENYAQKGYVEGIQITFDPQKVTYEMLLDIFWRHIDPTDAGGQFFDRGKHYRTVIFYHSEEQKKSAQESKEKLQKSGKFAKNIVTEILPYTSFEPAEAYHQQYYAKNAQAYTAYKKGSGREDFFKKVWADNDEDEVRAKLTPLQYDVMKCSATEPAFDNEYWNNKEPGIYVDRISGQPLFSSLDKFDSGTGWPSFTKPLDAGEIQQEDDTTYNMIRTEVRSKKADAHLGHLFADGPAPSGMRYCINSAALRFIRVADLEKEGYGAYLSLFKKN